MTIEALIEANTKAIEALTNTIANLTTAIGKLDNPAATVKEPVKQDPVKKSSSKADEPAPSAGTHDSTAVGKGAETSTSPESAEVVLTYDKDVRPLFLNLVNKNRQAALDLLKELGCSKALTEIEQTQESFANARDRINALLA